MRCLCVIGVLLLLSVPFTCRAAAPEARSTIGLVQARYLSIDALLAQFSVLQGFLPDGIEATYILPNTNAMLVKAKTPEAIVKLQQFVRALDQPVAQVMLEVELVQMTAQDAQSLGASWEAASPPVSAVTNSGGGSGNTGFRYGRGTLKGGLATMISRATAKVVSAPRLLVPSGGQGAITVIDPDHGAYQLSFNQVSVLPDRSVAVQLPPVQLSVESTVTTPVIRAKDGETVLLGAINGNTTRHDATHVPFAAIIPLSNAVSGSQAQSSTSPILVVFLTPHIVQLKSGIDALRAFAAPAPIF